MFFFFLSKHYTESLNFCCARVFWVGLFPETCFVSEVADVYVVTIECHVFMYEAVSFQVSLLFQCLLTEDSFIIHPSRNSPAHLRVFCVRSWGKWTCNLLITWQLYGSKTSKATSHFIWSLGECWVNSTFYQHMWKHVPSSCPYWNLPQS